MTYTTNYNFDLYELTDNANLMDGFNHNFEKLDVYLYQTSQMLASALQSITTLQTQVSSLEARVTDLEGKA